ncbi:MAG: hypothetical protein ACM338_06320, partial [Betaproteobacteria bacterium]
MRDATTAVVNQRRHLRRAFKGLTILSFRMSVRCDKLPRRSRLLLSRRIDPDRRLRYENVRGS